MRSMRLDGHHMATPTVYDTFNAKARTKMGKAADSIGMVGEQIQDLPCLAILKIHQIFVAMYSMTNTICPESWNTTNDTGLPKTNNASDLSMFRWIAHLSQTRRWFNKTWGGLYRQKKQTVRQSELRSRAKHKHV